MKHSPWLFHKQQNSVGQLHEEIPSKKVTWLLRVIFNQKDATIEIHSWKNSNFGTIFINFWGRKPTIEEIVRKRFRYGIWRIWREKIKALKRNYIRLYHSSLITKEIKMKTGCSTNLRPASGQHFGRNN